MFKDCYELESIEGPLFNPNTPVENIESMFEGCSELKTIPEDMFSGLKNLVNAINTFSGCKELETNIDGMFDGCTNLKTVDGLFKNCLNLHPPTRDIFKGCVNLWNIYCLFYIHPSLIERGNFDSIPEDLFHDCMNLSKTERAFYNRRYITHIPETIFNNCKDILYGRDRYMFGSCGGLDIESRERAKKTNWL